LKVLEILGIPKKIRVVIMLTLGYPDETHLARSRKKLADIVAYDGWKSQESRGIASQWPLQPSGSHLLAIVG